MRKTNKSVLSYPNIGEVAFHRNRRARRLTISIRPATGIRVTIPGTLPFKAAEDFVISKADWIAEKMEYLNSVKVPHTNLDGYKTRSHILRLVASKSSKITIRIQADNVIVNYPDNYNATDSAIRKAAQRAIEMAYRHEAHEYLPTRLESLASGVGAQYRKLSIKKTTSRWGSCSSKNNINLSIYLMKLPDALIDYVILHELCHIKHKNHSVEFWGELDKFTGGMAKSLAREMRKYRTGI